VITVVRFESGDEGYSKFGETYEIRSSAKNIDTSSGESGSEK
jgi:hypothetical protein